MDIFLLLLVKKLDNMKKFNVANRYISYKKKYFLKTDKSLISHRSTVKEIVWEYLIIIHGRYRQQKFKPVQKN